VIIGALTVLATFFALRLIAKDPWTPVVAASIVAFLPRFIFLSAFVTNDNLVNLLGAILVFVTLKFVQAPTGWRMASVGAVLGLLVTAKLSALPVAIVLVASTWLVPGWKHRSKLFGVGALTALGVSGWYLIQNTVRYGDPLARAASARYLAQVGGLGTFAGLPYKIGNPFTLVLVDVPRRVVNTFWYQSGWNQFHWMWPVNVIFWLVLATALAGLICSGIDRGVVVILTAITVAGFMSVWIVATQTSTYEARYAFVGLAAVAALPWDWNGGGCRSGSWSRQWDWAELWWRFSRMCSPSTGPLDHPMESSSAPSTASPVAGSAAIISCVWPAPRERGWSSG
jgi:hypothetical protein